MAHSVATPVAVVHQPSGPIGFADHVLNARVELYACLQLLADRARFITGATWAAVALLEGQDFVYCAAAGSFAPVIGSAVDVKILRYGLSLAPDKRSLLVRVIRESKTAGLFQLFSGTAAFREHDLQSIVRLAEMVSTAVDHMEAEARSIAEHPTPTIPMAVAPAPKPAAPVLWHAPESVTSNSFSKSSATPDIALSVYECESCGFPVSHGRSICFDCEERNVPSAASMVRLLSAREKQEEGWLSAHGYTIASLLISAVVGAIIYWLR
jgi:hypothetical protein